MTFRRVLIIADIEGSSGCWDYAASSFLKPEWALACADMTLDVAAVVQALFSKGVQEIVVKDFHRTGFNLLPEWIDRRARVDQGYTAGPIPGMGDPGRAEAVLFVGLHAASGSEGFLPHTMTSRLAQVQVNGRLLPEVTLFAALLASHGIRPVFFSGCPAACRQAAAEIQGSRPMRWISGTGRRRSKRRPGARDWPARQRLRWITRPPVRQATRVHTRSG